MLYFDAAATTPLHPDVLSEMKSVTDLYGNPSSKHAAGFEVHKKMEEYLRTIADIMGVARDQLVVIHGGTDGNRKVLWAMRKRFGADKLWASSVEHSSILDECLDDHRFSPYDFQGLSADASFAALMQANNETGTVFDIQNFREKFSETLILSDWVHGAGRMDFSFKDVDFVTISAHKFYGPKGVGILYLKNPEQFPELSKDTHTKDIVGVAGMAKAFELMDQETREKLGSWGQKIEDFITENIPDHKIHDQDRPRVPGIVNVAFKGVRGSELMTVLSKEESVCISTGSACTSDILSATTVMQFLEPDETWKYPIRISLHRFLTGEDVEEFCEILSHYVMELRK